MSAKIIDGKIIAADLRARVADEVARVKREHHLTPGLAVVLVGHDPASEVYVRTKSKMVAAAGSVHRNHRRQLPQGEPKGPHRVGHHLLMTDGDVDVVLAIAALRDREQRRFRSHRVTSNVSWVSDGDH